METKMKPSRIASTLAMLSAAAVGIATPAAVQQPTGRSVPTVQQPTRAPAQQQGAITIKLMPGAAKEIFKDLTRLLKVDEDDFYRQRG